MRLVCVLLLLCLMSPVVCATPQRSIETALKEAEAATRKLLTTNPKSADAHALLGVILDQRGATGEAEKEYAAALRLKPNLVSALSNLGVLLARTIAPPKRSRSLKRSSSSIRDT